ncbi:hypothetical protein OWM07_08145 [Deferribacter thermophilus]|uniref:hypothetical protein n=1 Tax=Deferribacter thermophilus TaxID=53573 RepID=UPI003C1E4905
MNKKVNFIILAVILVIAAYFFYFSKTNQTPEELVKTKCSRCHHTYKIIENKRLTRLEWIVILDRMQSNGANLSTDEYKNILDYLVKNYSK